MNRTTDIRIIESREIQEAISDLVIKANKVLPCDVKQRLFDFEKTESNLVAKGILNDLKQNLESATQLDIPICQDTGMAVILIELGQNVHVNGNLEEAINSGVADGYEKGLLRMSIVKDPLRRVNTNNNTPAIIHYSVVEGDGIKITVAPKGFGSENMSRLIMLEPSATKEDVIDFVVDTVRIAGANPCPPIVVGVGIGGNFEMSAILAKKALLEDLTKNNEDEFYKEIEEECLSRINKLNIGPQGFKGDTTALAVRFKAMGTHIAGLPLAVNISCHVTRHASVVL